MMRGWLDAKRRRGGRTARENYEHHRMALACEAEVAFLAGKPAQLRIHRPRRERRIRHGSVMRAGAALKADRGGMWGRMRGGMWNCRTMAMTSRGMAGLSGGEGQRVHAGQAGSDHDQQPSDPAPA